MTASYKSLAYIFIACIVAACSPSAPTNASATDQPAAIVPDYSGTTVPCNIAPLNFEIANPAEKSVAVFSTEGHDPIAVSGPEVRIPLSKWKSLTQHAKGGDISVQCYTHSDGKWQKHPAFNISVSADSIDPYIAYRLIEPSYISFEKIWIKQRCLENFDEKDIYNNFNLTEEDEGQCVNCHSFQDYNRSGNMQMHVRVRKAGTLIVHDGDARKVSLRSPQTISAGVYPAWHPTLPLIAYSVNSTSQNFHSNHPNKVEVHDAASDLILYDVATDSIQFIAADTTELETFPSWSPDGKWLYYASAAVPPMTEDEILKFQIYNYKDYKYNIYRRPFDADTRQFGAVDTVFMASEQGMSATHPRVSPDGRFLIFTMAEYGTFHIWHKDADLYIMDLATRETRPLTEVNSPDVESYHSFDSSGKWLVVSSRRDDGSYTRLYFAHIDEEGHATKPFVLPQADPRSNTRLFRSYNVPEFMASPFTASKRQIIDAISAD